MKSGQRARPESIRSSISRRIRFSDAWRHVLDSAVLAAGLRNRRPMHWLYTAGNVAHDLIEGIRSRRWPRHMGRAYLAALESGLRFKQTPAYRSYWHDAERNALVGVHLGVDLNRFDGCYYLVENNVGPAMREVRRALYKERIDPVLTGLVDLARRRNYREITLYGRNWRAEQVVEIRRASEELGLPIHAVQTLSAGNNLASLDVRAALPDPLPRDSLHVLFAPVHMTPAMYWINDKELVQAWYSDLVRSTEGRLRTFRWSRELFLPDHRPGNWPNLVVKLSDVDKGRAVAMGRFDTMDEACEALGLTIGEGKVPKVFRNVTGGRLRRLFAGEPRVIFQEFIPSDIVEGRLRTIRMHAFMSPLEDRLLSAHGVVAGQALPESLENGLLQKRDAFVLKRATALRLERLEPELEGELAQVAVDFGQLVRTAVASRFDIGEGDDGRNAGKET